MSASPIHFANFCHRTSVRDTLRESRVKTTEIRLAPMPPQSERGVPMTIRDHVGGIFRTRTILTGLLAGCLLLDIGGAASNSWAQSRANTRQIGILSFGPPPAGADADPERGVRQGLRELGYVEGRNVSVVRRYADGKPDLLAAQAAELVRLKVDVILAGGPATLVAARKATNSVPIVTISGSDPVRAGWA